MTTRILIAFLLFAAPLFSQTAENVLVVVNAASPVSMETGTYYAGKRAISRSNILPILTSTGDTISREIYERQIEMPVATWLTRNAAQDRILYIVLTKGIPLRIEGTSGQTGTTASVDSELTLLYRKMVGESAAPAGPVKNPYYLDSNPISQARQFNHADQDIYLVSRLDGYTVADIKALIDRGMAPSREGKILLDARGLPEEKGDAWLKEAADLLAKMGTANRVILESTDKALSGNKQVLGYYSWGSNDPAVNGKSPDFAFVPGALAGTFDGSSGRTFSESPEEWTLATAGAPRVAAAEFIKSGITGIAAQVSEPFLETAIRPNILFPAYVSGFNLVESYYLAMPYLSWQAIIIGDPLCAPFRTRSLPAQEIEKGLDPETELPAYFGERRLKTQSASAYKRSGVLPDTTKLMVRAEARLARQDQAGARQALEELVAKDNRLPAPQLLLATLYETAAEYDKAIALYRRLLEMSPNNPGVLNNLAFALAVRKNNIQEALPLAEKAYELGKKNPNIADTLGWIYHLSGQNEKALKLLEEAARTASINPELHLHFAIVSAEAGNKLAAEIALQRALELDSKLEQREEVKRLREKLK